MRTAQVVAFAPYDLVSHSDCISGLFSVDPLLGDYRVFAVELQNATRLRSAVQKVVAAEWALTGYGDGDVHAEGSMRLIIESELVEYHGKT